MKYTKVAFKKNKVFLFVIPLVSCFIMLPKKVEAQRKKTVRVKRSKVVVHKKIRARPIRGRRVAHYRYRGLPRWGKTVRTVGAGFVGVRFGGIGYRFHNGVWYRPKGRKSIVAKAPFGVRVRKLPIGHQRFVIGAHTYFYYYGTYYAQVVNSEEYQVVIPPLGAAIDALPDGYEIVSINDRDYYKFEDTYYEPRTDNEQIEYYVVIEPTALN
ncbi:DUF6515 family protein [Ulvibacterium marinum]|uniref:Uncharacterized protein n=1 Tax=Ulvibacterium marinum TaxID=2419782 RepID=A0A3B0CC31_9FLAO|nr:DUF6515 family protein [Ulvibacterium marinum]RKN83523.1 hypothetical protein D7Z94_06815 [Ulvibacterium marinum]